MKKFWAILMAVVLSCWAIPAMALEPAEQADNAAGDATVTEKVDAVADNDATPAANNVNADQPADTSSAAEEPAADEPDASKPAKADAAEGIDGLGTENAVETEADETPSTTYNVFFSANGKHKVKDSDTIFYTLEVAEGDTVEDAVKKLSGGEAQFLKDIFPEVKEKTETYGVEQYYADSTYKTAVTLAELYKVKPTGNVTYYAKWAECITEVELTVTPPTCGTRVETPMKDSGWDFSKQKAHPVISLPSKASFELKLDGYISEIGEEGPVALNEVTLEGGVSYELFANLQTKSGYTFSRDAKITINGAELVGKTMTESTAMQVQASVTAVHDWGDWKQTKAPTCVAPGEQTRSCQAKDCKATETQDIPIDPNAHEWGDWTQTKAPTCSSKGEEERVCKLDSEHVEKRDVDIDPNAHDWGDWKVTKKATSTTEGEKERVCKLNSEHVEKETIAKTGSSSSSSSKSSSTPKTGDSLPGIVGIVVAVAAVAGIGIVLALRRRRQ